MKLLIKNTAIIPMTGEKDFIEKGYLLVEGDIIKAVGRGEAPQGNYAKVIDGSGQAVLPGFINTHTHAAMTLLRGYADDLPLQEWLETKIWPMEDKLTAEDVYRGSMLAIAEMIKSGTTTFNDMYFYEHETARAVQDAGIRAVLSRGMIGIGPESERAFGESRELMERWHMAAGGRIQVMLGPHAPYTCPPDYLKRVIKLAADLNAGIHIHLAETRFEVDEAIKQYGKTPVKLMQETGLFEHRTIAAHCVHLSEEDIAIIKDYGVNVAHNPESNMKLASGIAPVPVMLEKGIPVSLGTDGASSNNNLDMLQEMRSCALLHKVHTMQPTVIPAYQALEMASRNGAIALGMEDCLGLLKAGMKADLILVSLGAAHMTPRYDIMANIVYSAQAGDVDTVMVNGEIIMENRQIKTFDEETVLHQARETAARLVQL